MSASASIGETLRSRLLAVEPGRRRRAVLVRHLAQLVAEVLHEPVDAVDPATPLVALGLDSARILELRTRLEGSTGVELSATLGWRFPTLDALAPYLAERMGIPLDAAAGSGADRRPSVPSRQSRRPRSSMSSMSTLSSQPAGPAEDPSLDGLSDEDLAALLVARLEQLDQVES